MKQEKLCESETMEELGAENEKVRQQLRDAEILASFPTGLRIRPKSLGPILPDEWADVPPKTGEYWAQKAEHNAKMGEKMEKLYSEHKTVRSKQVGGDHYKNMNIQPWDVIDQGPKEQAVGFYRYNALKYLMRAGKKGEAKEDIQKAQHYLEKLIQIL